MRERENEKRRGEKGERRRGSGKRQIADDGWIKGVEIGEEKKE